jgi:hypothetical protein
MKPGMKQIMKFVLLPQVMPRLRELFSSGFSHVSFFLGQIYSAAGLIPPGHPYLSTVNTGRFGLHHVVAEAARNLKFRKENADQIVIFFTTLVGMVMMGMQILLGLFSIFISAAHAAAGNAAMPTNFAGFFLTPAGKAKNDIAYVLLDRVFGVPGIFLDAGGGKTCVAQGNVVCFQGMGASAAGPAPTPQNSGITQNMTPDGAWPWPFHQALHAMMQFYSIGLLIVGTLIMLYFVVAVIAETAESGTPFGRRFNHVWAPIRLVVAMGLLVPVANGLNSAQYITLYAAKYGSGFATNGWNLFMNQLAGNNTLLGNQNNLVVKSNPPPLTTLLEFDTVLQTCKVAYTRMIPPITINAYLVKDSRNAVSRMLMPATYQAAAAFYDAADGGDILVRFGACLNRDGTACGDQVVNTCTPGPGITCGGNGPGGTQGLPQGNPAYPDEDGGGTYPFCGEVLLQTIATNEPGPLYIEQQYYGLIYNLWNGNAATMGADVIATWGTKIMDYLYGGATSGALGIYDTDINNVMQQMQSQYKLIVNAGVLQEQTNGQWIFTVQDLGWGGAAIWYNKIAQMNGALVTTIEDVPAVIKFPDLMRQIKDSRLQKDSFVNERDVYTPYRSAEEAVKLKIPSDENIVIGMNMAYRLWNDAYPQSSSNAILDVIRSIFGVNALIDIRQNTDTHPLALLSGIGKELIESAIRNLGWSAASTIGGGLATWAGLGYVGQALLPGFARFLSILAFQAMGIGFVLFYILPMMPFLYFFFAVGNWVKAIFEAMVGVPLWALAHLRIDGPGLSGDAAIQGYFLILEIFLRPILTLFGLLGSIVIYAAQVRVLNMIWDLVANNVTGFDTANATAADLVFGRGAVDQFFFTVIYAVIVYMMGMASFKMVDLVPNHTLQWMGAGVSSFAENNADEPTNLTRNVMYGLNTVNSQFSQAQKSASDAAQSLASRLSPFRKT